MLNIIDEGKSGARRQEISDFTWIEIYEESFSIAEERYHRKKESHFKG
jgi:hypothetical protein